MQECFICLEPGGVPCLCRCRAVAHQKCLLNLCRTRNVLHCTICKSPLQNVKKVETEVRVFSKKAMTQLSLVALSSLCLAAYVAEWCLYYTLRDDIFILLGSFVSVLFIVFGFVSVRTWKRSSCAFYETEVRASVAIDV